MPRKLDNWLHAYAEYVAGTESPMIYHLWAAIGTIAAAAQRKIYLPGKIITHSNQFIVLVGPSGEVRKSTAMGFAKNLLVGIEDYGQKVEIAPKKASSAALIARMARIANPEHQSITAYASELGTLLGANNTDVSDVLTDLWDCDPNWDKETMGRGVEKITAPWVNVIAATTPVWLADNLPKTAIEGGFVSRGLFVYADRNEARVARPVDTPEQIALRPKLIHDLAEIAALKGEFRFSESGGRFFDEWYNDRSNFLPKYDNRMTTFYSRKDAHVKKVAMAVSLAAGDSMELTPRDIGAAIDMVEEVEMSMSQAFQGVGRNIFSMDHERIKRQIQSAGTAGLTYKKILGANIYSLDKPVIDMILDTLVKMDLVVKVKDVFLDKRSI